jgi:hypothetical protein
MSNNDIWINRDLDHFEYKLPPHVKIVVLEGSAFKRLTPNLWAKLKARMEKLADNDGSSLELNDCTRQLIRYSILKTKLER